VTCERIVAARPDDSPTGWWIAFDLPRRRGPLDIVVIVIAISAPAIAATLLWNARVHRDWRVD
jgi:hypothetical protein